MTGIIGEIVGGFGGWIAGLGAIIVAIAGIWFGGRQSGASKAKRKAKEADYEQADKIRKRADEAFRHLDDDTRPVDERLRDLDGFRDD